MELSDLLKMEQIINFIIELNSLHPTIMIKLVKKTCYIIWVLLIIYLLVLYIYKPEILNPAFIQEFVYSFGKEMMLIYILLTVVRGFLLIPSTPFVIGGALLFPDQLLLVLTISIFGVMLSATALYYFSDMLGFSNYLENKYPKKIRSWKKRLSSPKATYFVLGWSFFPFVPTDLICYVAGLAKMPYKYMFIGVFFGELILDIGYIYFGSGLL